MNLLYLIGEPGVGKTTLLEALTSSRRRRVTDKPFLITEYEDGLIQLGGHRSNGFGGTDSLSMAVQPKAESLLDTGRFSRIVGEGDRLATAGFFQAARRAGYTVDVVLLEVPEAVAAARRRSRGSNQNPAWVKGRQTKIRRLADFATVKLDATRPVEELVDELKDHPVFRSADD